MTPAVVEVKGVTKAYGEAQVLRGIDLALQEHEAIALIGASGIGQVDAAAVHRPARGDRRRRRPA